MLFTVFQHFLCVCGGKNVIKNWCISVADILFQIYRKRKKQQASYFTLILLFGQLRLYKACVFAGVLGVLCV